MQFYYDCIPEIPPLRSRAARRKPARRVGVREMFFAGRNGPNEREEAREKSARENETLLKKNRLSMRNNFLVEPACKYRDTEKNYKNKN